MKAVEITKPNEMRVVDRDRPSPRENEVLVRIHACGICGTDIHIFRGEYLGGYPVIPGHEFAGIVEEVGSEITRFRKGDRVAVEPNISCNNCVNCLNNRQNFCLNWLGVGVTRPGGMAQFACVPENAVFSIGELAFEQGAFVEPLSCVIHGIERARLRIADRLLILGAGPIGILLLKVAKLRGCVEITAVDRNETRLEVAKQSGAVSTTPSLDTLIEDSYDTVIDATGALPVMAKSIDYARPGGTVLLFGVPPAGKDMCIEPFKLFRKGLTVLSSYTSLRNSYQAVDLLRSGLIDVSPLISHRMPLAEMQRGIELIEGGKENVMKVLMLPNGS